VNWGGTHQQSNRNSTTTATIRAGTRVPTEAGLRLCPETIYQALLFPNDGGLKIDAKPRLRTSPNWSTGVS
jgi:hypothetical protein